MPLRKNPDTSNEAYRSLDPTELSDIYRSILSSLSKLGEATFEDLAAHMKVDKSRVWKRMSELDKMELVYRPGNKRLLKSGRSGYTWMLTKEGQPKTEYAEKILKGETVSDISKKMQKTINTPLATQLSFI